MVTKKWVSILEIDHRLGTKYRIRLPFELGFESNTNVNGVLKNSILKSSIPKSSILKNNTQNREINIIDHSLSDMVNLFYTKLGQNKVSKREREAANAEIKKLLEEGFTLEDVKYTINWTFKNWKETPYSIGCLSKSIGQAMAAKKKIEVKEIKKTENEKMKVQQEEAEKKMAEIQEKINEHKESLNENQRSELRNKALEEIRKTKGIKEEFITKVFIEAKENEIIRKQLDIEP